MLSSIHPFGERSRNNSFGRTATAHIVGSAVGGLALGVLGGLAGLAATTLVAPSDAARTVIVAVSAAIALALEVSNRERLLPTRSRQVNENWIQTYRGWVYGGGWGAELGFGVSTIITTSLVHLLVVTMVFVGSLTMSATLGLVFGTVRGLTVLAARSIDSPDRLRSFHRQLDDYRTRSRSGAIAALGIAVAIGVIGSTGAVL